MRNSTIKTLILAILIILTIFVAVNGIKIGNFEILSISDLKQKKEDLEKNIQLATELATTTYTQNEEKLRETFTEYKAQKEKYEQLVGVTNKNDREIYETKQYDISYLWRVIGKYATEQKFIGDPGITLNIGVKKGKVGTNNYDFNFNVEGTYTRISQFITDLENDSDLYFRIYNFKMMYDESISETGEIVRATFSVKGIGIDKSTIK